MKKAVSIFLFCIFLFNVVGYFIAFKATESQVKNEIRSAIQSGATPEELVTVTINKSDMTTVILDNDGTEMIYHDERYDIVKSTETATTITYYCIDDIKETTLFAALDEHIDVNVVSNHSSKNSASKNLVKHVVKLYFSQENIFSFTQHNEHKYFSPVDLTYSTIYSETNSPPPKFA